MAIEFMRFKSVSSRSARLADYVLRNGEYETKEADFLVGGSAGLPTWATSPHDFFKEAEKQEHGEIGKHVIIALPKEFNLNENKELSEELLRELFPSHTYVWGIHENIGTLSNEKNPHLHILVCDRKIEPERAEPPRETYFKKSRTLKTGEISGGYRKDNFLSGSQRQKGLLLKKKALEKIMNQHIQKHNEKTGENVRKISFEERHGKGERHLGKNAIAVGIKERTNVVQSELDRRIKNEIVIQQKNVENAEKIAIKKCTNLIFEEKVILTAKKAVNFVRYFGDKSRQKKAAEESEMNLRRSKLTDRQKYQIFTENREHNQKIAENRVLKKEQNFNDGLRAEAGRRKIKNPVEYTSSNKIIREIKEKRQKEEIRRKIAEKIYMERLEESHRQEREAEEAWEAEMERREQYRRELNEQIERERMEQLQAEAKKEPEYPKFERQLERIAPHQPTEHTTNRKPEKKKNRGFER